MSDPIILLRIILHFSFMFVKTIKEIEAMTDNNNYIIISN